MNNSSRLALVTVIGFILFAGVAYVALQTKQEPQVRVNVATVPSTTDNRVAPTEEQVLLFPKDKLVLHGQIITAAGDTWEVKISKGTSPEDMKELRVQVLVSAATTTTLIKSEYGFDVIPATLADFKANDPVELVGKWVEEDKVFAANSVHNTAATYQR